jgi:hypothetical protein
LAVIVADEVVVGANVVVAVVVVAAAAVVVISVSTCTWSTVGWPASKNGFGGR